MCSVNGEGSLQDLLDEARKSGMQVGLRKGRLHIKRSGAPREVYDLVVDHSEELKRFLLGEPLGEEPPPEEPAADPWVPFPSLPEPLQSFVMDAATAIGCDPAFVALPLLCGLASSVGATRRVHIHRDWQEAMVLWGSVAGESGTQKSPSQEIALRPLEELQAHKIAELPELEAQFKRDTMMFNADRQEWNRKGRAEGRPMPVEPEPPSVTRYIIADQTIEAVAERLQQSPRGLLVATDEMSSWLGGMDRYKTHSRGEIGQWLSMHRAHRLLVDRKTSGTIYVKHAAISITGGLTPGSFQRAVRAENLDNGLAARLLVVNPPRRPKQWNEPASEDWASVRVRRLYGRLLALDFDEDSRPVDVRLSTAAAGVFREFVDQHGVEQMEYAGHMASVYSKLEGAAARFGLLFALVHWAEGNRPVTEEVEIAADDIRQGIRLSRWFSNEWRRLCPRFVETEEEQAQRKLVEWIKRQSGKVTARDVQMGCWWLRESGQAQSALQGLAEAGLGEWETVETGGRPKRVFRLQDSLNSTEVQKTRDLATYVELRPEKDSENMPDEERF